MQLGLRVATLTLLLLAAQGCKLVDAQPKGNSPLLPLVASPESMTLEAFTTHVPMSDPRLTALWQEVDEQQLPADLRAKLAQNGLRAGIVGPVMPDALADLLKLTDKAISPEERAQVAMETEEGTSLLVMHPRAGDRRELVTSEVHARMPLLQVADGQVSGKTLLQAQARLVLRVSPETDSCLKLELAPEIHHGDFRNHFTGNDSMMVIKQERQKKPFPDLNLTTKLAAGQMLVLTCMADHPGSLGHYMFAQTIEEKTVQKVYVFRASQAGPDRSFWESNEPRSPIASDLVP